MKICGIRTNRRFGVEVVESLTLIPPGIELPVAEDEKTIAYSLPEMKDYLFWIVDQSARHEELRSETILEHLYLAYYRDGHWHPFRAGEPFSVVQDRVELTKDGIDVYLRIVDVENNPCCVSQVLFVKVCGSDWTELAAGGTPFIDGESVLPVPRMLLDHDLHLYLFAWKDDIPCGHIMIEPGKINELNERLHSEPQPNY